MTEISNPIEMYHFAHPLYSGKRGTNNTIEIELPITSNIAKLHKQDVIALAKHFKLTGDDLL
ncbi:MAG: hypothetical protein ACI9N9_000325 [Enterobacterales bacterium]|jgi:hypothetical protein